MIKYGYGGNNTLPLWDFCFLIRYCSSKKNVTFEWIEYFILAIYLSMLEILSLINHFISCLLAIFLELVQCCHIYNDLKMFCKWVNETADESNNLVHLTLRSLMLF